jgi:hypothetical protein
VVPGGYPEPLSAHPRALLGFVPNTRGTRRTRRTSRRLPPWQGTLPGLRAASVRASLTTALDLCRGLLAYSAPGAPVSVPHAALAELIDLATVTGAGTRTSESTLETVTAETEPLQKLHDVGALGRRYNRAKPTIREWFRDGLFGPPEERRFRGKEYVATDDAVRDFERRTGLRPVEGQPVLLDSDAATMTSESIPTASLPPSAPPRKKKRETDHRSPAAMKILAAQGGSSRRQYG